MKGKVAHLSSVHPAVDTRITTKECATLAAAGYDVVFVCQHPRAELVNGVRIAPVAVRRSRLSRMTLGVWDILRAAVREHAQVYHFHDAELLFAGLLLRLTGAAVVYDVHEDVPRQILAKDWIAGPLRRVVSALAEGLEWAMARGMSGIVAATPEIGRRFRRSMVVTVQNFVMPEEFVVPRPTAYGARAARFAYVGGLARIRGVFEIVEATALVPAVFEAKLVLVGPLSHERLLHELRQRSAWAHVDYYGWQMREQVARHLDGARAGLLVVHPVRNYMDSPYAGKAFEYMAAGLPLIISDFPLMRELFEPLQCALFVDPLQPAAIAEAMTWILKNPQEAELMGARGKAAVATRFSWQGQATKLLRFYETLMTHSQLQTVGAHAIDA
jgi:glycosyltransferase involved in cell wall biosynthesis